MNSKANTQVFDIDIALKNEGLFIINKFKYNVGDFLFDSLELLLKYQYTSMQLRNGTIYYFLTYLGNHEKDTIISHHRDLDPQNLHELHKVDDPQTYLCKM
jgi:hypothetical protein